MQLALYRMERPETFEQIIGQDHIVRILENQIQTGHVSQAYLFTGTRGTGKTTTARILAKAVNCTGQNPPCCECENCRSIKNGTFMDVIELDAASNNGVDDLRAVIDSVQYPPAIGKYKVYIIDEVHMLTPAAENTFLKTLEEPPEYAIFILATTDPEKVKSTIKSRCMTLNFRRVSEEELISGMERICSKYGVNPTKEALSIISMKADGSVRDALSILEQCIETGEKYLDAELVYEYTNSLGADFYIRLVDAIVNNDFTEAFVAINEMIECGKDAKQMISDLLMHIRNLMIAKCTDNAAVLIGSSKENTARLMTQAALIELSDIKTWIRYLSKKVNIARYSAMPRIILEVAVMEMITGIESAASEPARVAGQSRDNFNKLSISNKTGASTVLEPLNNDELKNKDSRVVKKEKAKDESKEAISTRKASPEAKTSSSHSTEKMNFDEMWNEVQNEVARGDMCFTVMVGQNSAITSFENGEITLTVKPSKLSLAKSSQKALDEAARKIFGEGNFFTLKPGDIETKSAASDKLKDEKRKGIKTSNEIMDRTEEESGSYTETMTENISNVFGVDKSKINIVE